MKIQIDAIKVGRRMRKDMGDIDALAKSINEVGLLQAIVLAPGDQLVCGGRRLAAAKRLGWTSIEARTVSTLEDIALAEQAELEENTCRKDLLPSEAVAKAKVLEPIERKAAKERETAGKNQHTEPKEKFSEGSKGKSVERVAAAVGMSAPTLEKAKAVVAAAEAHPKHYGDLIDKMDKGGKVAPVHAEMVRRHVEEKAPPPPKGPTPAQVAKSDKGRRWCQNIHDLYAEFRGIRENGGLKKIALQWPDGVRADYAKECRRLGEQLVEMATELEGVK